jgi:hypothetical protein
MKATEFISEKWSRKYKSSINCANPKGFSQKAHCAGRKKNEDYDPNDTPPGPESKPTMPAGTVRVDVSDVYDWYKLGQHISNLKGLGQHDFGQGPPSAIMSFGSEDEEHKYIDALKKTGLDTTDIDPVDPNQPAGMRRQKTDPTYNVAEDSVEENLRDWFGKGKAGGAGGGGWDRYNTKGERIGKCGDRKPGEGKPKCLSKSRAASLRASGGKQAIATAVRRKRTKDTDPERSGAARNVPNKTQNENKDIETELLKKQLMARHPQAKNLSNAMALDYFKSQQQDRRDIVRLDRENDQEEAEIERLDQENDQEETEIERLKRTINQLTRGS